MDDLTHHLGFVCTLGKRDADIEYMRALFDLRSRYLDNLVVILGSSNRFARREPWVLIRSPISSGRGS